MCNHILNAQVSIRAPCCKKWFDCSKCHQEQSDHNLRKIEEMTFGCKKCKKVFRKSTSDFDTADEYCPHCDNHFVLEAKTKEMEIPREMLLDTDIRKDNSMLVDIRTKQSLEDQLKDFDYSELLG